MRLQEVSRAAQFPISLPFLRDFLARWSAFYRIRTHGHKISGLRLMGYLFFGYLVAGETAFLPLALNAFIVLLGIMSASAFNDYYDWKFQKEGNGVGAAIERGWLSEKAALFAAWIPQILAIGLFGWLVFLPVNPIGLLLLWLNFLLSYFYCAPPPRLKQRKTAGLLAPPLGIFLLFFQGFILFHLPNPTGWAIAAIVFLFACYLEFLHLVDDSLQEREVRKMDTDTAMRWLRLITIAGIAVGAIFSLFHVLFFVSVLAWALRFIAVSRMSPKAVARARKSLFHPVWRLEEFMIYGGWGAMHLFF